MFKKIAKFIKYNTLTTIIIAVGFVAVASVMASNDDVKNVLGEEIIETQGVDNTLLLATDLEEFDLEMKITNVMEDEENYYIDYEFTTLGIQDDVWQEIFRQEQLIISKVALEGRDLGLYVTEELSEIIDYQLAYLKEVQENEEEKGETLITETTIYTGLIGLVLDTKTKELPGYEPVVKPPVAEEIISDDDASYPDDEIPPASAYPADRPFVEEGDDDFIEDSAYYEFLIDNCLSNDGYWYNNTCNAEAEVVEEEIIEEVVEEEDVVEEVEESEEGESEDEVVKEEEEEVEEKTDEEICLEMELFWYEGECHVDAEEETTIDGATNEAAA